MNPPRRSSLLHTVRTRLALLALAGLLTQASALAPATAATSPPGAPTLTSPSAAAERPAQPVSVGGNASMPLSKSKSFDGAVGGELMLGRFRVAVPPGAFQGVATITMTIPDSRVLRCGLEITPVSANAFRVPLTLTTNANGALTNDPYSLVMGTFDVGLGKWVKVAGSREDNSSMTVSAPLLHFSWYGVCPAKAGW